MPDFSVVLLSHILHADTQRLSHCSWPPTFIQDSFRLSLRSRQANLDRPSWVEVSTCIKSTLSLAARMAWVVRRPTEYLENTTCPNSRDFRASTITVRILPSYTAPVYLRSSTHEVSYHDDLAHARAMCTRPFLLPSKGPGYEASDVR